MGGKEDTTSEAAGEVGSCIREQQGDATKFEVDADADDEFYDMFKEMWSKALEKLKQVEIEWWLAHTRLTRNF